MLLEFVIPANQQTTAGQATSTDTAQRLVVQGGSPKTSHVTAQVGAVHLTVKVRGTRG